MTKQLSLIFSCLLLTAGLTFGQTASFSFNDNNGTPNAGTYNPTDTLTLSLFGTVSGFTADTYSLWLEVPTTNGFNLAINITSGAQVNWTDANQGIYPKTFTSTVGQRDAGYRTDVQGTLSGDLGATSTGGVNDFTGGPTLLANFTFSLTNAQPGTYIMFTTSFSPKKSGISDDTFTIFANAPAVAYTFTVVPEPSSWSLLVLGGLGAIGFGVLRRRKQSA